MADHGAVDPLGNRQRCRRRPRLRSEATLDIDTLRKEWFGHWLHGHDAALLDRPPVRIFVMGENVWRDEHDWPLARTQWTPWYLHAGGMFSAAEPADSAPDTYTFDPRDPVPTWRSNAHVGGFRGGPIEQGDVTSRADVLTYTSDPLTASMEITGPVRAEIWVSTSAPDTDFTAKLVDLPLRPGAVYCLPIDLAATSILVPAGHRLQLQVSSSSWPMWEPNPNSGEPVGTDAHDDLRRAEQTVFHDPAHPSRIVVPIIGR
jgi:uncharacterized protein